MILTKTPFRVSLFGGGTDYPEWFTKNSGCTIGFALNYYCYISINPLLPIYGDIQYRVCYAQVEDKKTMEEIEHPAVRAILKHLRVEDPLEIAYMGDIPARTGLGAGSSFAVGLLLAVRHQIGLTVPIPKLLAQEAIYVERNIIGEAVGYQDQIFAALGGIQYLQFPEDGKWVSTKITLPPHRLIELEDSLVLVYTGITRSAPIMAARQIDEFDKHQDALLHLNNLAIAAKAVLDSDHPLSTIGSMLGDAWRVKQELCGGITTPEIDELYIRGLRLGALGGKLLGAGGGGFILFFVPPKIRIAFEDGIKAPCLPVSVAHYGAGIIST